MQTHKVSESHITSHVKSNNWLISLSLKSCHCIANLGN